MIDRSVLVSLFRLLLKYRAQLALENIDLRQQLAVYKRTVKRPKINDQDCIFWLTVMGKLGVEGSFGLRKASNGHQVASQGLRVLLVPKLLALKVESEVRCPTISMKLIILIRRYVARERVVWCTEDSR